MNLTSNMKNLLESLHDPVLIVSENSRVEYINKAYSEQFQVPREKLIGLKISDIEPEGRILKVLKEGKPLLNDYSYLKSLKKHVYANITPFLENGKVAGVVTIMKDISEINKLQEELNNYKMYTSKLEKELSKHNIAALESRVPTMQRTVDLAYRVAASDATVLLYGESGVGKEIFSHAIHHNSSRKDKPFVPINMASIPDSLFESELFGFEEGSFTGSKKGGKIGLFELGNGGTLFLDEIGEMTLSMQAKILRIIQELSYRKVGGTKLISLDVRIICATNKDLKKLVKEGKFREDLYYRLNVVPILIPPLRERKEDIPIIIKNLLQRFSVKYGKYVTLDSDVYELFQEYDWPGNVRELVNTLERIIVLSSSGHITVKDIHPSIFQPIGLNEEQTQEEEMEENMIPLYNILEETERDMFKRVLSTSRNRTEAIQKLGISRKTFYNRLKKYKLD